VNDPQHDKIQAKRDLWITLGIGFILAVFIMSVIIVPDQERWIILIMALPASLFLAWLYFGTYYVFGDEVLICRSGPFTEKIPYTQIKSLRLCENLMSSMALSRERIEIKQHGKGYITGTTYISPVNREHFLSELTQRCHHLDEKSR
jgi:hypothetical protein